MSTTTVQAILDWLRSLCEDAYPEDRLYVGSPDAPVTDAVVCWWPTEAARRTARERGAQLIIGHEAMDFDGRHRDPGCPPVETWLANRRVRAFYEETGTAFVRCHRTLDAWCIPRVLGERLGFPEPVIHEGHKGYEFTLVYDLPPQPFGDLVRALKERMALPAVRASATSPETAVRRVGLGWGGVSNSANLQYMERLREHGVEVVIGGEVDEFALEFYRESGLHWIELGHYATEIIGLEKAARDLATAFPQLDVVCHREPERIAYY